MALSDDLERIAAAAEELAEDWEEVAGVLAAEPLSGGRVYLCAYGGEGGTTWLLLDEAGSPVASREAVRDAASIVALCELAEENAGGGRLEELRARLVTLRLTEAPAGIDEAEAAALALEQMVGSAPRVARPDYLDSVGAATRELERTLGEVGPSPFAEAMKQSLGVVDEFVRDVESSYKLPLS